MSEIPAGLRADYMRTRIEDKATIKHTGGLYVGTNTAVTYVDTKPIQAVETEEVFPTNDNQVLQIIPIEEGIDEPVISSKPVFTTIQSNNFVKNSLSVNYMSEGTIHSTLMDGEAIYDKMYFVTTPYTGENPAGVVKQRFTLTLGNTNFTLSPSNYKVICAHLDDSEDPSGDYYFGALLECDHTGDVNYDTQGYLYNFQLATTDPLGWNHGLHYIHNNKLEPSVHWCVAPIKGPSSLSLLPEYYPLAGRYNLFFADELTYYPGDYYDNNFDGRTDVYYFRWVTIYTKKYKIFNLDVEDRILISITKPSSRSDWMREQAFNYDRVISREDLLNKGVNFVPNTLYVMKRPVWMEQVTPTITAGTNVAAVKWSLYPYDDYKDWDVNNPDQGPVYQGDTVYGYAKVVPSAARSEWKQVPNSRDGNYYWYMVGQITTPYHSSSCTCDFGTINALSTR